MRRSFAVVAAAFLIAGSAHASSVPFVGTLSVKISALPPISIGGSGTAVLNGSGSGLALTSVDVPDGRFATVASVPVTSPDAFPIGGVLASLHNGPGSFGLGGVMAIKGSALVCLFGACDAGPAANVEIPFTLNGTRGIGIGGGPIPVPGMVNVTLQGSPWSLGTVSVPTAASGSSGAGSETAMGFVHGPASGGAESAAQESGVLQLVTPIVIHTNIGAASTLPAFGILNLHFGVVPEPGTLLLLGSGVAGLGLLRRTRSRK